MKLVFGLLQLIVLLPVVKNWAQLKVDGKSKTAAIALISPAILYLVYLVVPVQVTLVIAIGGYIVAPLVYLVCFRREVLELDRNILLLIPILGMIVPMVFKVGHYPGALLTQYFQMLSTAVSVWFYFKDSETKVGILHSCIMIYLVIECIINIKLLV